MSAATEDKPRSKRGQRARETLVLDAIDQIRMVPAGVTGTWAYYLRPDGATIRDALVINPNGGIPDIENAAMRARYGTGAPEFRRKEERKGHVFLGSKLTPEAVGKLVRSMGDNREDEILWCQEQIADTELDIQNSDRPEIRDQARKRRRQLQKRIDTMLAPFDADALLAELEEIAHAQMLASVDPNVLRVMKALVGEVNQKLQKAVNKFAAGKAVETDPELTGVVRRGPGRPRKDAGSEFSGSDFIDAD